MSALSQSSASDSLASSWARPKSILQTHRCLLVSFAVPRDWNFSSSIFLVQPRACFIIFSLVCGGGPGVSTLQSAKFGFHGWDKLCALGPFAPPGVPAVARSWRRRGKGSVKLEGGSGSIVEGSGDSDESPRMTRSEEVGGQTFANLARRQVQWGSIGRATGQMVDHRLREGTGKAVDHSHPLRERSLDSISCFRVVKQAARVILQHVTVISRCSLESVVIRDNL